jgi:hypothetical protein
MSILGMAVFQAISDRAYVRPAQRRPSTIPVQDNKSAIATIRSSSAPWQGLLRKIKPRRPCRRREPALSGHDGDAIQLVGSSSRWPYSGTSAVALRQADAYVKSAQRKLAAAQHGAFGA